MVRARVAVGAVVVAALAGGCSGSPQARPAPTPSRHPTASASTSVTPSGSVSPSASPSTTPNPGGLDDARMVGQLFMTYVYGASATSATPEQRAANLALYGAPTGAAVVRRWHLGGVILIDHNTLDPARPDLSTGNVGTAAQTTALDTGLQRAASADGIPPLLVATDQEGGVVQRITDGVDARPSQLSIAHQPPHELTCGYATLGRQLRALGVTMDFAPVADVVRTSGGVIGDRSFGPDPSLDATDVAAAVAGLQGAGVLATLKHWPGHGSTSTDSHLALAVIHEPLATWREVDLVPFVRSLHDVGAVMVGHLALPALDPTGRPATFSPVITRDELERHLGYRGLVVTDSLWMAPARAVGTPGEVALRALSAGDHLLLEPPDLPASYRAVLHAVHDRPDVRRLVQQAVSRVLAAKERTGSPSAGVPGC